jgi:NitT/TauT family transport system ATP-binding protein
MTADSVDSKAALRVRNLSYAYAGAAVDDAWAIRDLSLAVDGGEIVCILGASGCGKSTLLNLIAGLLSPHDGVIEIGASRASANRIGYIFQDDALFPWRTVEANLMLACDVRREIARDDARQRISQYLSTFHLSADVLKKFPSQLSGGMRQRVSIIQSLMFNPELLLLDEPFSALDFYTKLRLETEFYQLVKEQNKAAILVTHDIEEAIAMADRVYIMSKGRNFIREFKIDSDLPERLPENARGTDKFAGYYREIWSELKAVIGE